MPHGLDHIVHTVRDLDAAAEVYRRAGFTVGARNRHAWGTHNRIVQLKNCYIEILTVAEPEKIVPHGARSFSFGAFHRDFLARREGFSMLILNSGNAAADARAFEAAGIGGYDVFDFAREGSRPDGTPVKLAFSLVFARDAASPNLGFAACQHHFPENFWDPAFQTHANGAKAVPGVALVAGNPADHHIFLKAFSGVHDLHSSSLGVKARTENGDIDILEEIAFRDQFGVSPDIEGGSSIDHGEAHGLAQFDSSGSGASASPNQNIENNPMQSSLGEGMTLDAMRFEVADIAPVEALLRQNAIATQRHVGRLVVSPEVARGATLIFEAA